MRQKSGTGKAPAEQVIKNIRRATRKQYDAEEKIRIVLEGLRGEESIAALCRARGLPRAFSSALRAGPSTAGMIAPLRGASMRWKIAGPDRTGFGTASPIRCGTRSSIWR